MLTQTVRAEEVVLILLNIVLNSCHTSIYPAMCRAREMDLDYFLTIYLHVCIPFVPFLCNKVKDYNENGKELQSLTNIENLYFQITFGFWEIKLNWIWLSHNNIYTLCTRISNARYNINSSFYTDFGRQNFNGIQNSCPCRHWSLKFTFNKEIKYAWYYRLRMFVMN